MLKFNSIFIKIKLFYHKFFGSIDQNHSKIEIKELNCNPENILIIFPIEEKDFRVAAYTFRNFVYNKNTQYHFLINRVFHSHFHLKGNTYKLSYLPNKNKVLVDETFFADNMLNTYFDIVVDLNEQFNYDLALLINKVNSTYKIGFTKEYSDMFYNLQFDNSGENKVLEDSYNKIKLILS